MCSTIRSINTFLLIILLIPRNKLPESLKHLTGLLERGIDQLQGNIERIVLLDFFHRLVSPEQTKLGN
jgi:hypothetical protein